MDSMTYRTQLARRAIRSLREVLAMEYSIVVRLAAVKSFELAFETVWKAGQLFLRENQSVNPTSPKMVFRDAGPAGLLTEEQVLQAFQMAHDRNLAVHIYREDLAAEVYGRLPECADLLEQLLNGIENPPQQSIPWKEPS